MKKFTTILALGLLGSAAIAQDTTPVSANATPEAFQDITLVQEYQATITPEELAAHLYFFASDFFEGRETTARGQKMAAHYLASQYRALGLMPKGRTEIQNPRAPENYLQPFPLVESKFQEAQLTFGGKTLTFGPDAPDAGFFRVTGDAGDRRGELVFGGYGISEAGKYDDYQAMADAGLDLTGKWILVLDGDPIVDGKNLVSGTEEASQWASQWWRKWAKASQAGAAGMILVGGSGETFAVKSMKARSEVQGVGQLELGKLDQTKEGGQGGFSRMPFFTASTPLADQMISGSDWTIQDAQEEILTTGKPVVFALPNQTIASTIKHEKRQVFSENVLAFLEGTDPVLKDEVVVITSHYDHVGMNPALEGDQIYNGADDDGSGTVSILEIAQAFVRAAEDGYGPRRSILFMNVSGEEKGLLGSRWFSDEDPIIPLEKIVTNLNIDMIGRVDPTHPGEDDNYVYIIGSNLISQELHDINVKINEMTGIDLDLNERFNSKDDPNQFYRRSDHWNFGKHGIPFIFFFTGTHDDYHGVDDHAEKIEYQRMAQIARVIFATAWQVANQDKRPVVSGKGFN